MKPYARHKARSLALQALFEWQFAASKIAIIKNQYLSELNPKKVDVEYFNQLLLGITENLSTIDDTITPFLDRKIKELDKILHQKGQKIMLRLI